MNTLKKILGVFSILLLLIGCNKDPDVIVPVQNTPIDTTPIVKDPDPEVVTDVILKNIKPTLLKTSDKELLILTVNLHTYQETQQDEKLNLIADLIAKMDVDFIAFQECAQNKSSVLKEGIIKEDNMALLISEKIKERHGLAYNYSWGWAHYGWDVWEEGVAVLSKHPLVESEDRYISFYTGTSNLNSRKAIYASYQTPLGNVNFFSAHTHWRTSATDEQHNNQVNNIKSMATEKEALTSGAVTFVCGDFNVNPTSDYPWSEGYNTMVKNGDYSDTFLEVYPTANNKPAQSSYNTISGDFPGRIDYIFMKKNSKYKVQDSQIVFTSSVVGKVSDHYGVLTKVIDTE